MPGKAIMPMPPEVLMMKPPGGRSKPVSLKLNVPLPPTVCFTTIRVDSNPVTLPDWLSFVAGAGLPSESVPWPRAVQALAPAAAVNVQVKSCDANGASVTLAGVKPPAQPPVPVTFTLVSGPLPVLVSVTTMVTVDPASTLVGALFSVNVVAAETPFTLPDWLSFVAGAGLPSESVPWPRAVQALAPAAAVNVQVKSCDANGASISLAGVKPPAQPPVPVTFTLVSGPLPVLVSVTTMVTVDPASTLVGALFSVNVVAAETPFTLPDWLSFVAGAGLPSESVPWPRAVQALAPAAAVNVQVKSCDANGASVTLAGVKPPAQPPVPVTFTLVSGPLPVLVSVTTMVTVDPASTLVGALFSVNVVAAETPFTLPDWLSFVAGAGLPSESVPWPRAVQALAPAAAVNVQVKSCDANGASISLAGVKPPAQPPVPVTFTLVSGPLPVLVSVTTMVTVDPASTLVGALFSVNVVAAETPFTLPDWLSFVAGAGLPSESVPWPRAVQALAPAAAVNVQVKSCDANGASVTLAGVKPPAQPPVPVTFTLVSGPLPVLVSVTTMVTVDPASTLVGALFSVNVVAAETPFTLPDWLSFVAGAGLPSESVPWPRAVQALAPAAAVNVQVKSCDANGASISLAGVKPPAQPPVPVTFTLVSGPLPVLVSVTTMVTVDPASTLVGALFSVNVVAAETPFTLPDWLSFVAGAGLPSESVPWPRAVQALAPAAAVNVQVKSCDANGASVTLAGVKPPAQPPVPVTFTLVSGPLPVLVSVTTMVTVDPASTLVGALFSVNVVAAETPFTLPDWLSFVAGAGLPSESVPWPRAVQALAPAAAVNVQVKSCDANGASVTLAGVKPPAQPPVPVTFTLVSGPLPVLVSVTTMVTVDPASTLVGALFSVNVVAAETPFTLPDWLSFVAGAGLPSESVPWPRAVQALAPAAAVNVQVKSCDANGASVTLAGVKPPAQPPVPVTFTLVSVSLPVLVSVTTMVTVDPASTLVGALFSVNVVAAETPFTLPDWLSFVAGAGLPSESVPWPRAVQALAPAAAVNVQVKSCDANGASVTLAGVK